MPSRHHALMLTRSACVSTGPQAIRRAARMAVDDVEAVIGRTRGAVVEQGKERRRPEGSLTGPERLGSVANTTPTG